MIKKSNKCFIVFVYVHLQYNIVAEYKSKFMKQINLMSVTDKRMDISIIFCVLRMG